MTSPTPEGQRVAGEQTCASVEEAISKAFAARGGAVRFMPDGTVRYVPYEAMYLPPTTSGRKGERG